MLYLKRKSDGKEFAVWKYFNMTDGPEFYIWRSGVVKVNIDEYELIFKP
jgi:hypothetical protein